ncbi:MAG: T9SS type A sorting domain-containing protein [Ignavibacteriaceae bacterium]
MKTLLLLLLLSFTLCSQSHYSQIYKHSGYAKHFKIPSSPMGDLPDLTSHLTKIRDLRKNSNAEIIYLLPREIIAYRSFGDERYWCNYTTSGQWTDELWQVWENSAWVDDYKNTAAYDGNGYLVSILGEQWSNGIWENDYRGTLTNDAMGRILTEIAEFWSEGAWVPSARYTSTYDASGNILSWTAEGYQGSVWENESQYTFTYDASGNLIQEISRDWVTNVWVNKMRTTSSYDGNGNVVLEVFESYTNGAWVNTWQNIFSYNASGYMITERVERWENSAWVNYGQYTCTYDANAGLLTDLYQRWESGAWANSTKCEYINDNYGYVVQGDFYKWQTGAWATGDGSLTIKFTEISVLRTWSYYARRILVQYFVVSGINYGTTPPNEYSLLQNYPNPFNPETVIRYGLQVPGRVSLKLFDLLGNEVATLVNEEKTAGAYEYKLSTLNYKLSSGVYFYQIRAGRYVSTKKMVVLK